MKFTPALAQKIASYVETLDNLAMTQLATLLVSSVDTYLDFSVKAREAGWDIAANLKDDEHAEHIGRRSHAVSKAFTKYNAAVREMQLHERMAKMCVAALLASDSMHPEGEERLIPYASWDLWFQIVPASTDPSPEELAKPLSLSERRLLNFFATGAAVWNGRPMIGTLAGKERHAHESLIQRGIYTTEGDAESGVFVVFTKAGAKLAMELFPGVEMSHFKLKD